ncbi:MAG: HNH endonuclease, partial [Halobacteriales archaeon]
MATSERECIEALREAAERLGESPTKAQYEELGLTPASATIIRTMGSWNEAKEAAGLETNPSTGSRVGPKPDDVDLPDGVEWTELSVDQRWHYRNVKWNTERTLARRARLRQWVDERKREAGCRRCGTTDPACLDFHHPPGVDKIMDVGTMVTYGYGKETLSEEMSKCEVLCA